MEDHFIFMIFLLEVKFKTIYFKITLLIVMEEH
jgi:hypothetical protein